MRNCDWNFDGVLSVWPLGKFLPLTQQYRLKIADTEGKQMIRCGLKTKSLLFGLIQCWIRTIVCGGK